MNIGIDLGRVAAAINSPLAAVTVSWQAVEEELDNYGILTPPVAIAALATIRVECGRPFLPVTELGGHAYFIQHYWENVRVRARLGNLRESDAYTYCGRGLIQTTGRANYLAASVATGIDLLAHPELALEPAVSAKLFALYFHTHHVAAAAADHQWTRVRELVNGGHNQLTEFLTFVAAIQKIQIQLQESPSWQPQPSPPSPSQSSTPQPPSPSPAPSPLLRVPVPRP